MDSNLILKLILLSHFLSFSTALPYHTALNNSNNTIWQDLNKTMRDFNRPEISIHRTIQNKFPERTILDSKKNISVQGLTNESNQTVHEIENVNNTHLPNVKITHLENLNETELNLNQDLNLEVHEKLNSTLSSNSTNNSSLKFESTIHDSTTKRTLTSLIHDSIHHINSTLNQTNLTIGQVIIKPVLSVKLIDRLNISMNSTKNESSFSKKNEHLLDKVIHKNESIPLIKIPVQNVKPVVQIINPIQANGSLVSEFINITEIVQFDQNDTISVRPVPLVSLNISELVQNNTNLNEISKKIDKVVINRSTSKPKSIILNDLNDFDAKNDIEKEIPKFMLSIRSLEEDVNNLNLTVVFETLPNCIIPEKQSTFSFSTSLRLVFIESLNQSVFSFDPHSIEEAIKHSILKNVDSKFNFLCVNITYNKTINPATIFKDELPIILGVHIKSPILLSEEQFENALVEYSINNKRCIFVNNTEVTCSFFRQKDKTSLLRISDYWIGLNELTARHAKLNGGDYDIFTYKPAWIIGLGIIGGIIATFFFGCIVAICYTRRPYKRCGKVYEIDSVNRKNNQPYIPVVHPATKASAVTRSKEIYYQ